MKLSDPQQRVLGYLAEEQLKTGTAVPGIVVRRGLRDVAAPEVVDQVLDSIPEDLVTVGGYKRPKETYSLTLEGFQLTRYCGDVARVIEETIRFFDQKLDANPYETQFNWAELREFLGCSQDRFNLVHTAVQVAGLHGGGGSGGDNFSYSFPSDIEMVLANREIGQLRTLRAKQREEADAMAQAVSMSQMEPTDPGGEFGYDVALSFAGEDRHHVEPLAELLKGAGMRVFYDKYETATLWGKDLYVHLHDVYSEQALYVVMFASASYVNKVWTNHERQAAQERALHEKGVEYILPVRIDDTKIPGLPTTVGYIGVDLGVPKIFELLMEKLGRRVTESSATEVSYTATYVEEDEVSGQIGSLSGLTEEATYVLRSACERVLEEDSVTGFLDGGEELLLEATPPLGREECRDAIDLLVELGHLQGRPVFGAGRKWIAFTVTADGFRSYGEAFLPDFQGRERRLLKHIVRVTADGDAIFTSRIATTLGEQHAFVCLVLAEFIERGALQGQRMGSGDWTVHSPSATMKVELGAPKAPADFVFEILQLEADEAGEVRLTGPEIEALAGQRAKKWDLQAIVIALKDAGRFRRFYSEGAGESWTFSLYPISPGPLPPEIELW